MLLMCYGILEGRRDDVAIQASRNLPTAPLMAGQGGMSLSQRLNNIVTHPTKARATGFIANEVIEAFELVATELQKRAIVAKVTQLDDGAKLTVHHGDAAEDFTYAVRMISQPIPAFALSDAEIGRASCRERVCQYV